MLSHTGLWTLSAPSLPPLGNRCIAELPEGKFSNWSSRSVQLSLTLISTNGRTMLHQLLKIFTCIYIPYAQYFSELQNWNALWLFELIPVALQKMRLLTVKHKDIRGSRNSVSHNHTICLVTRLCARWSRVSFLTRSNKFFSSSECPDGLQGQVSLLFNG